MHSLNDVKTIGGIGSLLTLLALVPSVGFLLGIVGAVLVLVAVKYASDILGDPKIFNNMLYAVIVGIVGLVVAGVAVATFVLRAIGLGFMSSSFAATPPSGLAMGDIAGLIGTILLGLVAIWICFLVSAIFLRRSYTELGNRLNVGMFGTAALLYLIGAALTIILVGLIIMFIAQILLLVAFFSIDTQTPPPMQPTQPAQPTM
jgi:uncharacterized membrane protein